MNSTADQDHLLQGCQMTCYVCGKKVWFWDSKVKKYVCGAEVVFHSYCWHTSKWARKEQRVIFDAICESMDNKSHSDW